MIFLYLFKLLPFCHSVKVQGEQGLLWLIWPLCSLIDSSCFLGNPQSHLGPKCPPSFHSTFPPEESLLCQLRSWRLCKIVSALLHLCKGSSRARAAPPDSLLTEPMEHSSSLTGTQSRTECFLYFRAFSLGVFASVIHFPSFPKSQRIYHKGIRVVSWLVCLAF